jgi:3-deoxy-7-phosphoheptulonate synthase
MVIITNPNITHAQLDHIREQVEARGMSTRITRGERQTIIGCIGDNDILREMALHRLPGVQSVVPVMKP